MTCIVQIWWVPDAERPDRAGRFTLVEFLHADDFEQACNMLDGGGLIAANDLRVHRGDTPSQKVIHARRPLAFRGVAVARAELPDWTFCEDEA